MKNTIKLPGIIHVRWENPWDDDKFLVASHEGAQAAIEDDGPTRVGVYKLVSIMEARKVLATKPVRQGN